MGMAMDIKKLGEDIVSSYNMRVNSIREMVSDTHKMLKEFQMNNRDMFANVHEMLRGFQADHNKMAVNLRRSLEKGEIERVKDFKAMMGDVKKFVEDMADETANLIIEIQKEQKDRNKEVADLLEKFTKDHEFMANELRKSLAEGETDRLQDFKTMISGIQKYVAEVIKETERLMREIQSRQPERREEVLKLLQEFKVEREKMATYWQKLSETVYRMRGGKMPVKAAEEVKTFAKAETAGEAVKSKGGKRGGKKNPD